MKKHIRGMIAGVTGSLFLGTAALLPAGENPIADMQEQLARKRITENESKVKEDLKKASLPDKGIVYYTVPAMSDIMRMPDVYPRDGEVQGELRFVAAQGEFEPASFQLYSFKGNKDVTLKASALKGPDGAVIPESAMDLKVVKVWYQNGNAWNSYFADFGLKLVPELLLHDENMILVDKKEQANYARVLGKDGKVRYEWISAPKHLDPLKFRPAAEDFMDAETLQPVTLEPKEFKQFFATVQVPEDQKPGVYRGEITVASGKNVLTKIPVALRVLPFELPLPKTYYDINKPIIVSFMGGTTLSRLIPISGGDRKFAKELYRKYLISLRNHGISHPWVDQDEESFALVRELGFETNPFLGTSFIPWFARNFGGRLSFDDYMKAKEGARKTSEFYNKHLGHNDILVSYGDEQGTAFVATHRNFFRYLIDYGIRMGCAGHEALLYKGGYAYGFYPMGGAPDAQERIRPWNEIGDKYVGFYATQHTGSENPQFIRRQHGLLGYLNNLSLVYNYEFALGPWNDLASELYKPMVVSYLNRGGLVDTLQYEGFREGVDDMRYATKLKMLADEANRSDDTERKLEARKALQFLALLQADEMDLEQVRAEMINYILKLLSMKGEK